MEVSQVVRGKFNGGSREDDCIEPMQRALERLGADMFVHHRKAELDPRLNPTVRQRIWAPNNSMEVQPLNLTDTALPLYGVSRIYTSPPETVVRFDDRHIKTPRPDVTTGFSHEVFCKALEEQDMVSTDIADFLNSYQDSGKSHGGHILEAQNQGMVGIASLGLLLKRLDDLASKGSGSRRRGKKSRGSMPFSQDGRKASVFLIRTQDSWLELWEHDLEVHSNSVLVYKFGFVTSANACVEDHLLGLFLFLAKMFSWASSEHLPSLAKKVVQAKEASSMQA
ncbi:hypothetical protein QQS21_005816 [Conoideocrella luteorostrata]|uniref:Uncharacterized protein n=1 Tax=Conoideocrella luteorostrata TaxID=1105319 RepID=A0AAJ0CP08_9HYPO|nr:hypothetical protein QQS21_005816 [Conoideocrella luteorostrata]